MNATQRGLQHDTDVLIRQVNNHLVTLRMAPGRHDVVLAELLAASLRALVIGTSRASAADRARVRAAVHYFVLRRDTRHDRRSNRSLVDDLRVVNRIAQELGRDDLMVLYDGLPASTTDARAAKVIKAPRGQGSHGASEAPKRVKLS